MLIAALLVAVAVVVAAAIVVAAARTARKVQSNYERSNDVVPGVPTPAPTSWLGSHDPEARLHRRLADAMKALRANQSFDQDGSLLDLRVELEQQALTIDAELVATASLPLSMRQAPLQTLAGAVETIERAVAGLTTTSASEAADRLQRVLDDLQFRTSTVAQARAALDEIDAAASGEAPLDVAEQPPTPAPLPDPGASDEPTPGAAPG